MPQFKKDFSHPQAYCTSNALDRLMNYQDRILYSIQYLHGHETNVLLYLRFKHYPKLEKEQLSGEGRSKGISRKSLKDRRSLICVFQGRNRFRYHRWIRCIILVTFADGVISYRNRIGVSPIDSGIDLFHSFDGAVMFKRIGKCEVDNGEVDIDLLIFIVPPNCKTWRNYGKKTHSCQVKYK
jgi:hypothetical protein